MLRRAAIISYVNTSLNKRMQTDVAFGDHFNSTMCVPPDNIFIIIKQSRQRTNYFMYYDRLSPYHVACSRQTNHSITLEGTQESSHLQED